MSEGGRGDGRTGGRALCPAVRTAAPPARSHSLSACTVLSVLLLLSACPTVRLSAQGTPDLDESRRRLEEIRKEREQLQADRTKLQGQVHDLNTELDNIERQRQATNRLVNELDKQINGLNSQVDRVTAGLLLAQDNLAERRAVLGRRLADIYKRGSLWSFEVLVAAESFGDLLNRSKYLYLSSRQDRTLFDEVQKLQASVQRQRDELLGVRTQLGQRREEREGELHQYTILASERSRRLRESRRKATSTDQRLSELERDEARLTDIITAAEKARAARANKPGASAGAGSITTADIGKLDWPVDGPIVVAYGRQTLPNGAVVRRNGIGIGAPLGTPVKAVESGTVELIGNLGTYGSTVVLDHGDGYWSVYSHLQTIGVKKGGTVTRGEIIGTVGGDNTDEGPHLYFEIRGSSGIALDPAEWLKKRK